MTKQADSATQGLRDRPEQEIIDGIVAELVDDPGYVGSPDSARLTAKSIWAFLCSSQ